MTQHTRAFITLDHERVIAGIFPAIAAKSQAVPFAFFAAMMLLQFVIVLMAYPETKGMSFGTHSGKTEDLLEGRYKKVVVIERKPAQPAIHSS